GCVRGYRCYTTRMDSLPNAGGTTNRARPPESGKLGLRMVHLPGGHTIKRACWQGLLNRSTTTEAAGRKVFTPTMVLVRLSVITDDGMTTAIRQKPSVPTSGAASRERNSGGMKTATCNWK